MKETVFITGTAGFIGFHLCKKLLEEKFHVVGIDNLNSYYDIFLKKSRIEELRKLNNLFIFYEGDIENLDLLQEIFLKHQPSKVFNLAAQAGVRDSIKNPISFLKSNIIGFGNILEVCAKNEIKHLIYASSSSVYGGNTLTPYFEDNHADHPVSLYATTKRSNELMAHTYSHLYSLPSTGLRFFTVYGPWGRPDMSYFLFTKSIYENKCINIFNYGEMDRDFIYIDDLVECLLKVMNKIPMINDEYDQKNPKTSSSWAPHKIFNIGNSNSTNLLKFIEIIEETIEKKAIKNFLPMQKGDVKSTLADTSLLEKWVDFKPRTPLADGIKEFVNWYKIFYQK